MYMCVCMCVPCCMLASLLFNIKVPTRLQVVFIRTCIWYKCYMHMYIYICECNVCVQLYVVSVCLCECVCNVGQPCAVINERTCDVYTYVWAVCVCVCVCVCVHVCVFLYAG